MVSSGMVQRCPKPLNSGSRTHTHTLSIYFYIHSCWITMIIGEVVGSHTLYVKYSHSSPNMAHTDSISPWKGDGKVFRARPILVVPSLFS